LIRRSFKVLTCEQLAARVLLYDPAGQFMQAAPPAESLNLPATHSVHAAALVAAGVPLALPASHCDEEVRLEVKGTVQQL
jgi:hypothetical protein